MTSNGFHMSFPLGCIIIEEKKKMINVVSSLHAPKNIKETDVSNSKFRQLFAGCHYNNIISNLDDFS